MPTEPYYEHGGITIYHGDCRDVMPQLDPVDLVLTDPPYGISYNREAVPQGKHVASHRRQVAPVTGDVGPFDPSLLLEVGRGRILWGANCYASRLPDSPKWIAWDKVTRNNLNLRIAEVEFAWTDCVHRPVIHRHLWSGGFRASEHGEAYHPTQKPVSLMRWCMERPGVPSGTVLDPFMGSGTTLRAAKDLGRKAIGIEIEEKYCEIAAKGSRKKFYRSEQTMPTDDDDLIAERDLHRGLAAKLEKRVAELERELATRTRAAEGLQAHGKAMEAAALTSAQGRVAGLLARIAELERERDEALRKSDHDYQQLAGLTNRFARMEAERDRLRGDLVLYGQHQPGCLWHERNHADECDCGWDDARALRPGSEGE